jgi:hypothetical protein
MDENMSKLLSETNKESIPMLMKSMRPNGWSILESKGMIKKYDHFGIPCGLTSTLQQFTMSGRGLTIT